MANKVLQTTYVISIYQLHQILVPLNFHHLWYVRTYVSQFLDIVNFNKTCTFECHEVNVMHTVHTCVHTYVHTYILHTYVYKNKHNAYVQNHMYV